MKTALDIPPGLVSDDTTHAAAGRWADGSNMRFRMGRPQTIGGWESLVEQALGGVCRTVSAWTDNDAALNFAFGTHATLEVWRGGGLFDVTPTLARPSTLLGANPFSVVSGQALVSVHHPHHGFSSGEAMAVSGSANVGGATPNGAFSVTVIDQDHYTYTRAAIASTTETGGGTAVVIAPQAAFSVGEIDGTGSVGYGTGGYGVGGFGDPSTSEYFPRTWALAAWGENMLANPRGGTIYAWTNDTMMRAAPLANAPTKVTHMVVAPQDQVFALGCNEEVSGVFNHLCIRHSSVRDNTEWNTGADTTAREYVLPGGGRIVAGRVIGSYLAVWTTQGLFLGQFVGSLAQPWRFDRVGDKCGLIGPNAVVVVGPAAYWVSPDRQFFTFTPGGAAQVVACPIRQAFADNLSASQSDKIVASSISEFSEVRFDYPDAREGFENSRYIAFSLMGEGWHRGVMARTAMVDAGPATYPCGVAPDGRVYWHERGQSADGAALSYFIETADQMLGEDAAIMVREVRPDFQGQAGPVNLTLTSRFEPQGGEALVGPYAMAPGARKADLRATGRYFKVRFSGDALPARCRIGRVVFDTAAAGER